MGACYANDINDIREDVLQLYFNSHLYMLQTTTEFDLKVNLPPKINLSVLLVAIFFKRETGSHRKQKGSRETQNKDKHKFSMKIFIKLKIYKIILWN